MAHWDVEFTDTFGREANYSWVRRERLEHRDGESDRSVMMRARKAMGLTGIKGETYWHGDNGEFRPHRSCTVLFVNWNDWQD